MRVGLLWRGDPAAPAPTPAQTRFRRIFEAFADREVRAEPYVLCEINVSGVYPIPDESVPLLVDTTIDSIRQSAAARFGVGSSGSPG